MRTEAGYIGYIIANTVLERGYCCIKEINNGLVISPFKDKCLSPHFYTLYRKLKGRLFQSTKPETDLSPTDQSSLLSLFKISGEIRK